VTPRIVAIIGLLVGGCGPPRPAAHARAEPPPTRLADASSLGPATSWWGTLSGAGEEVVASEPFDHGPAATNGHGLSIFAMPVASPDAPPTVSISVRDYQRSAEPDLAFTLDGPAGFHRAWTTHYSEPEPRNGCEQATRPCDPVPPVRQGHIEIRLPLRVDAALGSYRLRAAAPGLGEATAAFRLVGTHLAKAYTIHDMGMASFESVTMAVVRAPVARGGAPVTFYVHRLRGDADQLLELAVSEPTSPANVAAIDALPAEVLQGHKVHRIVAGARQSLVWVTFERRLVGITITGESRMFEAAAQAYLARFPG
jgi:hypothetical protein